MTPARLRHVGRRRVKEGGRPRSSARRWREERLKVVDFVSSPTPRCCGLLLLASDAGRRGRPQRGGRRLILVFVLLLRFFLCPPTTKSEGVVELRC